MRKTFRLTIAFLYSWLTVQAQDKILWDGELPNPAACNYTYGSILSGPDAQNGNYYFRAEPDNAHNPRLGFNCSGAWRADISSFDELRFYIRSNLTDQMTSVRFTTYFAKSNWVNLTPYIQTGGLITHVYKEVRIPLALFKTADYDLSSIEYLEFGTSAVDQVQLFVDNIKVTDGKSPAITFEPISSRVAQLHISERFDTTGCYNVLHYSLQSQADPNYQNIVHPVKIGRHSHVTALTPGSSTPVISFRLYLIFDKPLKNDIAYTLKVTALKDLSNNGATLDTTFTFSDLQIDQNIKANQVGYLPDSPKLGKMGNFLGDAWFMPADTLNPPLFQVLNGENQIVFNGTSTFLKSDASFSGERVFELDFSSLVTPGNYHLYVPGYGRSKSFTIAYDVYDQAYFHTARALFFQRTGTLAESHAGNWARSGLPDPTAQIHSSHSTSPLYSATDYPPGTKIPMTKGWLDAGDYGRYVPTAASAMFILFTAFELYPQKFPDNHLNIPESGNNIPDLLDELKYETDWLKQMQAPDGGVYFRVTPATWSPGLPGEENNTLFVSEKTTQSTALFAAAMAMAYRSFKKYLPAYADSCLYRAKNAWTFLQAHPQPSANVNVPGISAGPYPDPEDRDNRAWAAAELYKSTGEAIYHNDFLNWYSQIPHEFHATMSWQQHTVKAAWAYATSQFQTDPNLVNEFKNKLNTEILVNYYNRTTTTHAYHGAYHPYKGFIGYGTFGMAQSYAFDYVMFSYLLKKPELLNYAKIQLDIPLGNNPLSQSFITGLGSKSPHFPLHWSTVPGKFEHPVPGIPVFGPAASLVMNRPSSFAIQDSANLYPYGFKKEDPYPVLRKYTDAREAVEMSEFTVQEMAVTAAAFAFFSSVVNQALPVRFVSFEARTNHCHVELNWVTSEETNADYFSIERTQDGKVFREIGRQTASGNTRANQHYTFTDTLPDLKSYYRLKQVDFDGKFEFTRIIFASNPCAEVKIVITEPQRNFFQLNTEAVRNSSNTTLTARLFNIKGVKTKEFPVNQNSVTDLDGSGLTPGIYILKIHNNRNEEVFTGKLIIL